MLSRQFISAAFIAVTATGGIAYAAGQQGKVMYRQADGTYVVNTATLTANVKGSRVPLRWRCSSRTTKW